MIILVYTPPKNIDLYIYIYFGKKNQNHLVPKIFHFRIQDKKLNLEAIIVIIKLYLFIYEMVSNLNSLQNEKKNQKQ